MAKYEHKESYKHLFAKNLLAKWLREAENGNDYCGLAQFTWRKNYGIFTELMFHETDDPYYFECSQGLEPYSEERNKKLCTNWFKRNFNRGRILFVPDIVIFHKGTPKYIIEIIKTNPLTDEKVNVIKNFFKGHMVEIVAIYADEILRHDISEIPGYLLASHWEF